MNALRKFFEAVNGNKTLICTIVLLILNDGILNTWGVSVDFTNLLTTIFGWLAAGAGGHKVYKTVKKVAEKK